MERNFFFEIILPRNHECCEGGQGEAGERTAKLAVDVDTGELDLVVVFELGTDGLGGPDGGVGFGHGEHDVESYRCCKLELRGTDGG